MPDIKDGDSVEIKGSGKKPYLIKNIGGVYSCSCPAWRNQSLGIEKRTCKHIRKVRGDAAEKERIGSAVPLPKTQTPKKNGPPILLAQTFEHEMDPTGWWMSEKLDGVRAYWNGSHFLSRQGNKYIAPKWFTQDLPNFPLDGELWIGRGQFQSTVSIVRRQDAGEHWKQIRFLIFDAPEQPGPFEDRISSLQKTFAKLKHKYAKPLHHELCNGFEHLKTKLSSIEKKHGEGLMLREPNSLYEVGRSTTLLKVKTFHDAEAKVIGHQPGKGKHKGRLGALLVQLENGIEFAVGTGFSDQQRNNPPQIGSLITFRYQSFSDGGVPRFPTFVRLRTDIPISTMPPADTKSSRATSPSPTSVQANTNATTTEKTEGATSPPAQEPSPSENLAKRYFELNDDKSHKFWEIAVSKNDVTVRYGRIGTDGRTSTKTFKTEEAAQKKAQKQILEKTNKGYQEQT